MIFCPLLGILLSLDINAYKYEVETAWRRGDGFCELLINKNGFM